METSSRYGHMTTHRPSKGSFGAGMLAGTITATLSLFAVWFFWISPQTKKKTEQEIELTKKEYLEKGKAEQKIADQTILADTVKKWCIKNNETKNKLQALQHKYNVRSEDVFLVVTNPNGDKHIVGGKKSDLKKYTEMEYEK